MKKTLLTGIAALFLATGTANAGKIVFRYERGGNMQQHADFYRIVADAGMDVEIRGRCISACTQIMAYVPSERICFDKRGTLEFHMGSSTKYADKTPTSSPIWTQWMWVQLPENIQIWLRGKGWLEKATTETLWVLTSEELWAMGYRKCKTDDPFEGIPSTSYPPRPGSGPGSGG
jgi:hypothetical protein